jgi:hypothetical protein
LALAATILKLHESELEIESATEGARTGTCIRLRLARAEMEEAQ